MTGRGDFCIKAGHLEDFDVPERRSVWALDRALFPGCSRIRKLCLDAVEDHCRVGIVTIRQEGSLIAFATHSESWKLDHIDVAFTRAGVKHPFRGQGLHHILIQERVKLVSGLNKPVDITTYAVPSNLNSINNLAAEGFKITGIFEDEVTFLKKVLV